MSITSSGLCPQRPASWPEQVASPTIFGSASRNTNHTAVSPPLKVIRFGGGQPGATTANGLWVTVERHPVQVGGLGVVSKSIPTEINKDRSVDLRVLMPYLKPLHNTGFTNTGISISLKGHTGKVHQFDLMQRFEEETGTWVYAVANEDYFGKYDHIYLPKNNYYSKLGRDGMWTAIMMFNRAAEAFLPYLSGAKPVAGSSIDTFDGKLDFAIANDWHTGPFIAEAEQDYPELDTLFMLHNTYNESRWRTTAKKHGLRVPQKYARQKWYSPLRIGIDMADGVIANRNYVGTIVNTDFAKGADFVRPLRKKLREGHVYDMHHFLANEYSPETHPRLAQKGFSQLQGGALGMAEFKQANKLALQRMLGLNEDPDAIIFNWTSRFEPYQKGFMLVMHEAKELLKENPNVQLVMVGGIAAGFDEPRVKAFMTDLQKDPELKGRLYLLDKYVPPEDVIALQAGSDFMLMPSLYEPYGLVQIEAMKMGAIPIAHGVDGLRSVISDPKVNRRTRGGHETVWQYGQTGILMPAIHVREYQRSIGKWRSHRKMNPAEQAASEKAQSYFKTALNRALELAKNPDAMTEVRQNGYRYVTEQHSPSAIAHRYTNLIGESMGTRLDVSEG